MPSFINKSQIEKSAENTLFHLENEILYKLCRTHSDHLTAENIIAKTLLIGRTYSAAIDRRKNKKEIGDNFYVKKVVPLFKKSKIDLHLKELSDSKKITDDNLIAILKLHNYLTKQIEKITGDEKISFTSKYLHFHLPHLFFLYDTRAVSAFRNNISKIPKDYEGVLKQKKINITYATLFCKCLWLRKEIKRKYKVELSPRQLDNILLNVSNKKLSNILKAK